MTESRRNLVVILLAATCIISVSVGIRATLGLFLRPMTLDLHWSRAAFGLAIAIQNLMWGVAQPFTGMLADRYGTGRVLALGGIGYAVGLYVMSLASTPEMFTLGVGLINGMSISATSFAIVFGAVGRMVPPEKRSMAMGIASAGGSIGQFIMLPLGQALISALQWRNALVTLAVISLVTVPLATLLVGRATPEPGASKVRPGRAFREAIRHKPYWLLFAGFFTCGFHVAFIGTHLPAYLADNGISTGIAATALALIGLFNIFGSLVFGWLGGQYSKKRVLSGLYFARAIALLGFMAVPLVPASVILFACAAGFLWLGTVPLTSGLVGQIFGVRYLSTLFGFVFLGHQIGSFLGVWLAGIVFDMTGSYTPIWWAAFGLALLAAIAHWPIDERAVPEPRAEPVADLKPAIV
jgi:predicted MFS family arabinose efflux permease